MNAEASNDKRRTVPLRIDKVHLGGYVSPRGDWFEHDLAALAPYAQRRHAPRRICYDVEISRIGSTVNEHGYHPALIVVGEQGYTPTTFDIGACLETCLENERRANEALGLSEADVEAIIESFIESSFDPEDGP